MILHFQCPGNSKTRCIMYNIHISCVYFREINNLLPIYRGISIMNLVHLILLPMVLSECYCVKANLVNALVFFTLFFSMHRSISTSFTGAYWGNCDRHTYLNPITLFYSHIRCAFLLYKHFRTAKISFFSSTKYK